MEASMEATGATECYTCIIKNSGEPARQQSKASTVRVNIRLGRPVNRITSISSSTSSTSSISPTSSINIANLKRTTLLSNPYYHIRKTYHIDIKMSLAYAPTVTVTGGCVPVCADYISCGQTFGGCFTSCPGVPTPEPTIPDYVISACVALGSTIVSTATQPEYSNPITVIGIPSVSTAAETTTETVNTISTQTGVFTILTDTTSFTTKVYKNATAIPRNGTTSGLPTPTDGQPSAGGRGISAIHLGIMLGALIATVVAGAFAI
ncbi:hypothetical protein TWF679_004361 [Orbilia oligospora]|uniref:Uncharacterized protein n=1 Tax=Orbilia oligospora TaxID=2813651 RepID=A0A8H8VMQ0_ORBOL|nr:hypothetical protein TWF679_004361 [Orbilia oligospora]